MSAVAEYPRWVCLPCGRLYGRRPHPVHVYTMHPDICGVCGKHADVTEPRDFGHLKPEWASHGKGGAA